MDTKKCNKLPNGKLIGRPFQIIIENHHNRHWMMGFFGIRGYSCEAKELSALEDLGFVFRHHEFIYNGKYFRGMKVYFPVPDED